MLFAFPAISQNYCRTCNLKLSYGNGFSTYDAGWGVLSYSTKDESYQKNWDADNIKFCSQNHASIYAEKVKAQDIAEDKKKYVPTKRTCDYCEKVLFYKTKYFYLQSNNINYEVYSLEDPRKYNKIWRGASENSWDATPKVIYCSKKCANEAPR
jgi:hypothetical protein